jgi:hypothetical protein
MSQRSMIRNRNRELQRSIKRSRRRAKVGAGIATVVGAAALAAPSAQGATFQVTNLDDSGPGSLRDAVDSANAAANADTITFAPSLSGQITLTDEIEIDAAVDIQGPGASVVTISGDDNSRIFNVDVTSVGVTSDPVSISGLTLTDGYASSDGGAIAVNYSDLTLTGVTIRSSYAESDAGALDVYASPVAIVDSRISGNFSDSEGGAIYTDGVNADDTDANRVTIRNSVVTNNYTSGNGGAMYVDDATGGNVLIVNSEISDNTAGSTAGGIMFYGHKGGSTIRNSTISGNRAGSNGGGLYFDTSTTYLNPNGLMVENSTISGNRSDTQGGGAYISNAGDRPVTFRNSSVTDNHSEDYGAGIYREDNDVTLSSTIVADNSYPGHDQDDLGESTSAAGSFNLSHTLVESDTSAVTITPTDPGTNVFGLDPRLGPLQDNGGPTETQMPQLDSPAIDAGDSNGLDGDQRGFPRRVGQPTVPDGSGSDGADIGAVERERADTSAQGAHAKAHSPQKQKGDQVKVKVKAGAAEAIDLLAKGKIKAGDETYTLDPVAKHADAGQTKRLVLKPAKKSAVQAIRDFLGSGKQATAKVKVKFTDSLGNTEKLKVKAKLKG